MRFLIINRRHNFARDQIGCAYLQGDDPLTASRYEIFLRQYFGKKLLALKFKLRPHESEPLQAGARQNNRVPIAFDKFAQTGWHISAQPYDLRAGVLQRACLCRRTLPVAIVATGMCAAVFLSNKSSTAPRGNTAAIISAPSISLGKSFALCTATSMRFSISARSSSVVKIPLRPFARSSRAKPRDPVEVMVKLSRLDPPALLGMTVSSPLVRMILVPTLSEGRVRASASLTIRVCANANSLPRVPRTISCRGVSLTPLLDDSSTLMNRRYS